MNADDIRKLYREETAATDAEAAETRAETLADPEAARHMIMALFALSDEDKGFQTLLNVFLKGATMQIIMDRATEDDAFALRMAAMIHSIRDQMEAPPERTPRGRPRPTKAA